MNVLVISPYPDERNVGNSVFVYALIQELSKLGCNITVVSPQPVRFNLKELKSIRGIKKYGYENAIVLRPVYFDFPNRVRFGPFSMGRLNIMTFGWTVFRAVKKLDFQPNIVYSHFLFRSGSAAPRVADFFGIPSVVALGESNLSKHESIYTKRVMRELISKFSGIISVSEKNRNYVLSELGYDAERIAVIPNAINSGVFYPRNKAEMREKYKLPKDKFLVAFTGHFIERKGPLRVLQALERFSHSDVAGIFIGNGEQKPNGQHVAFRGRVSNSQVAELLSASDVFVLPTLDEGSCNAIYEAMACGLPIISSNIEAIREQVDLNAAILCDPNNIQELSDAIALLHMNSELRQSMQQTAKRLVERNTLERRAQSILDFLKEIYVQRN